MKPDFKKWLETNKNYIMCSHFIAEWGNQFAEEYAKETNGVIMTEIDARNILDTLEEEKKQEAIEFGMFMKFDSEKYKDEYRLAYQKNQTDLGFTEYCYQKYKNYET